jgi:hypothetical protein
MFYDLQPVWSDTLFDVFKRVTIFGRQSNLDDRVESVFIFEGWGKKVKVKISLEQATKAQRGSRVIALLFL